MNHSVRRRQAILTTAEILIMWTSVHKMSSIFARWMRAVRAKLCVRFFFVRTKILLIFISFSSRLDFRFGFSLVNENLKHFVIFVIVVVD